MPNLLGKVNKTMTHKIALGLGTNIGDCIENLRRALARLAEIVEITAVSPIYLTPPWGVTDQPDFHNLCAIGFTPDSPQALLQKIKQAEYDLGRRPAVRWGPRLIDIDILFYDDLILHKEKLNIPHARIPERAFVLVPLADIAPDWVHPETGQTVTEMKAAVSTTGIKQLMAVDLFPD